ncbi:hypothetical protein IV38_GL001816 [Lactobacillus selangorensis]|uniref:Cell surface protein n=1 Tax=Lactobacillus selangorensis TaxID=81857 RepID=A0A0R2FRE9_9LACO|nr:hypothetical protein [Lactobacillus selangorensis]KRN27975.1 hypothetical protein IV38_GL001816 [Lactobacillus selangorensis]KRN30554.1 hypothetical protein IV40_GL001739 [Lactobacillus selangorensis]
MKHLKRSWFIGIVFLCFLLITPANTLAAKKPQAATDHTKVTTIMDKAPIITITEGDMYRYTQIGYDKKTNRGWAIDTEHNYYPVLRKGHHVYVTTENDNNQYVSKQFNGTFDFFFKAAFKKTTVAEVYKHHGTITITNAKKLKKIKKHLDIITIRHYKTLSKVTVKFDNHYRVSSIQFKFKDPTYQKTINKVESRYNQTYHYDTSQASFDERYDAVKKRQDKLKHLDTIEEKREDTDDGKMSSSSVSSAQ